MVLSLKLLLLDPEELAEREEGCPGGIPAKIAERKVTGHGSVHVFG